MNKFTNVTGNNNGGTVKVDDRSILDAKSEIVCVFIYLFFCLMLFIFM
jgi:hypothetical protein